MPQLQRYATRVDVLIEFVTTNFTSINEEVRKLLVQVRSFMTNVTEHHQEYQFHY